MWIILAALGGAAIVALQYYLAVPGNFPKHLPVIPLTSHLYHTIKGVAPAALYDLIVREPMEKHGAVIMWKDGRWAILVASPEYITQVFRNEGGSFPKADPPFRTPGSRVAKILGQNFITSDGALYNRFRDIVLPSFQRGVDMPVLKRAASRLVGRLSNGSSSKDIGSFMVDLGPPVWLWSLFIYAECFLDQDIEATAPRQGYVLDFATTCGQEIIVRANGANPLTRLGYLFPKLAKIIPWMGEGTETMRKTMGYWNRLQQMLNCIAEVRRKESPPTPGNEDKLIYRLGRARDDGAMSTMHYDWNMMHIQIAGQENTQATLLAIVMELGNHPALQDRLRRDILTQVAADPQDSELEAVPLLMAVIYEALRLHAPHATMVNRWAPDSVQLGDDIFIPKGTFVGWHSHGLHTNPNLWGKTAGSFDPDRWGSTTSEVTRMAHARQAKGHYMPFGLYARKCPGRVMSLAALRLAVCELLREFEWETKADYTFTYQNTLQFTAAVSDLRFRKRTK